MYFILDNIFCFIDWYIEGDSTIDQRLALIDRQREAVRFLKAYRKNILLPEKEQRGWM